MREGIADLPQRHERERRRQVELRRNHMRFQGQLTSTLTFSLV
jgi:hypothetical protein